MLQATDPTATSWALSGLAVLSGVGLVAGFLTPGVAVGVSVSMLAMAAGIASPIAGGGSPDWSSASFVAADALALAMLGPGAHSIDAWLFGRREIIIPDAHPRTARP